MTKNVLITVKGVQQDDAGEMSSSETVVHGEYYFRNGSHYIFYEETVEDSGEKVKSNLKLKGNTLELIRKGAADSRMIFETGKRHAVDYATPFGVLKMETVTFQILLLEEEEHIRIEAEYDLWANEAFVSRCTLTINLEAI